MVDEAPGRGGRKACHWRQTFNQPDFSRNLFEVHLGFCFSRGGEIFKTLLNYYMAISFSFFFDHFIGHDIRNPSFTDKKEFMVVKPLDGP